MDDRQPSISSDGDWRQRMSQLLGEGRSHAQIFIAQQTELGSLEESILSQLEHIAAQIHNEQLEVGAKQSDLDRHLAELREQAAALDAREKLLARKQSEAEAAVQRATLAERRLVEELHRREEEVEEREQELASAESLVRQSQRALSFSEQECAAEREQIVRLRQRLEEQRQRVEEEREQVAAQMAQTKLQRRRIAQEFREQHTARLTDFEKRRREIEELASSPHGQVAVELTASRDEATRLREESAQLRKTLNARADELKTLRGLVTELSTEAQALRDQHDLLSQNLAVDETLDNADRQRLTLLEAERNTLAQRLAGAEAQLAQVTQLEADTRKKDDLQRRFEMAVDDVRELKRRNSELEERLAKAPTTGATPHVAGGKLDWEAQKKKLLASLEADFDEDDPHDRAERLSIDGTIRITDDIIVQKDREIAELKKLLIDQSSDMGYVARDASAVKEVLDHDQVVQQEREKLLRLQAEWQDKLRKAEVDISVERAKIARDRAAIEEKLQSYQSEQSRRAASGEHVGASGATEKNTKPPRGRWLTRLGLKDLDG